MTSPPDSALTEAERAAFLQSIARVCSAAGRALRAAQTHAVQGTAAHGTGAIATGQAPDATESAAQAAVDFIAQLHQGLDTVAEQARANGPQASMPGGLRALLSPARGGDRPRGAAHCPAPADAAQR